MKETGSEGQTPEQLMQQLEAELAVRRSQTAKAGRNRAIFLVGGVLFILVAAGAALLVLEQMLSDMRPGDRPAKVVPTAAQ